MGFAADEFSFASGISAEQGSCAWMTKTLITTTMGTGTGSHPRAWTA